MTFAEDVDGVDELGLTAAAEQWAAYKQALAAVEAAAPAALNASGRNPLGQLDDAVSDLATYAHWAGIRAGAASEHLRLAMIQPRSVCRCNGHGYLREWTRDGGYGPITETCPDCGGLGTVPMPAVRLTID